MDEQRVQAYVQLIDKLLTCPNGEEAKLIQQNNQLIDEGFLKTVKYFASKFEDENKRQAASFLFNLREQLAIQIHNTQPTQSHLNFLLKVLRMIRNGKRERDIYPILEQHIHLLNDNLIESLEHWSSKTFEDLSPENKLVVKHNLSIFCDLISNFLQGDRDNNTKIAIAGYKSLLTIINETDFLTEWSSINNSLGCIYASCVGINRQQYIEKAIYYFQISLKGRNKLQFPEKWAMTKSNLGIAYAERLLGDRSQNIKIALKCYEDSLTIYTPQTDFIEYLRIKNLIKKLQLVRELTENEINEYHQFILKLIKNVLSRSESTQILLEHNRHLLDANLIDMMKQIASKADNDTSKIINTIIDQLIVVENIDLVEVSPQHFDFLLESIMRIYYKNSKQQLYSFFEINLNLLSVELGKAIEIWTHENIPDLESHNQSEIITIIWKFCELIANFKLGNKYNKLQIQIRGLTTVLSWISKRDTPSVYGAISYLLGISYWHSIQYNQNNKTNKIEKSIQYLETSITLLSENCPVDFKAIASKTLGVAYISRIQGDRLENQNIGIQYLNSALETTNREESPNKWAEVHNNLGALYLFRKQGDHLTNLTIAKQHFNSALEIVSESNSPLEWAGIQNNLGIIHSQYGSYNFAKAIEYFHAARRIATKEFSPRKWADIQSNLGKIYCIKINNDHYDIKS